VCVQEAQKRGREEMTSPSWTTFSGMGMEGSFGTTWERVSARRTRGTFTFESGSDEPRGTLGLGFVFDETDLLKEAPEAGGPGMMATPLAAGFVPLEAPPVPMPVPVLPPPAPGLVRVRVVFEGMQPSKKKEPPLWARITPRPVGLENQSKRGNAA
jgi:hypothetical protein